jgi:hypothetical protein
MADNAQPVKGRGYVLYGFAIGFGALLAVLGILQIRFSIVFIPLIAYVLAVLLNLLTQKTVCKKTNASQAFSLSAISAVIAFIVYLAATYINFLGSPIRSLIPNSDALTQRKFIQGFYLFWAGLYGQIVSGGFMQMCS